MYEESNKKERNYKSLIFKIIIFIIIILIGFFLFKSLINKNPDTKEEKGNTFAENFQNLKKVAEKYYTDDKLPSEIGKTEKVTLKQLIEKDYIDKVVDKNGKSCSTANSYAEMKKTATNKYSLKVQLTCDDEQNYIISTITKEVEQENDDIDVGVDNPATTDNNTNNTENVEENNQPATNENTSQNTENKNSVSSTPIPNNTTTNQSTTSKKTTTKQSSTSNKTTTNTNSNKTNSNNNTNQSTTNSNVKKVYYVVSFNPKGCKDVPMPQNILKGGYAHKPADPVRNGYKFLGWYYNGTLFDFSKPINQSYALEAKWQKKS